MYVTLVVKAHVFQVLVPRSNLQNLFFHFLSFYYQNNVVLSLIKTKLLKP